MSLWPKRLAILSRSDNSHGFNRDIVSAKLIQLLRPQILAVHITPTRVWLFCLIIASIAVGVRLLQWQNNFLTVDKNMTRLTALYKAEAQFLLDGDLIAFLKGSKRGADTVILTHPPGYPILLATIYKIGPKSDRVVRLFQIACEAIAASLVFLIALRVMTRGAALLAGLLTALSPQLAFRSVLILPDSLCGLPLLIAILLIVKCFDDQRINKTILAGGCIGVSCWFRADALLLPLFFCLVLPLIFPRGQRKRHALALIGGATLTIAPITLRNAIVFRSFVPVSLGSGVVLIEGIADYDVEKKFGFSSTDDGTTAQEALLFNRPDYADNLFRPDGIERERSRLSRGLSAVRSDPAWFLVTMIRRIGMMLQYEAVSIISAEPTITHSIEPNNEGPIIWSGSLEKPWLEWEMNRAGKTALTRGDQDWLRLEVDDAPNTIQLVSELIPIQKNFDYLLKVPVRFQQGRLSIIVAGAELPPIVASAVLPDSLEREPYTNSFLPVIQIPFVSSNHTYVRLYFVTAESSRVGTIVDIGQPKLIELGPATYLWTRYPRVLVKSVQKLFVARYFLPLTILGLLLLLLYRQKLALALILPVPVYYLVSHAPLHFEYRYLLPVHFLWYMLVGVAIYWTTMTSARVIIAFSRAFRRTSGISNQGISETKRD